MNYIILAAGMGTRLHPYTRNYPKSMLKLRNKITVLQRTINCIKEIDVNAKIYTIIGFEQDTIKNEIKGCNFIENPFYRDTNSIASLWFAKDFLNGEVTMINADVVYEKKLWQKIIDTQMGAFVCMDASVRNDGDYNVKIINDEVVVMSKELNDYDGEYAGVTKLNAENTAILRTEIFSMVKYGFYNEWYENALVQCVLDNRIKLKYVDIQDYNWAELDSVNDLFMARTIKNREKE